MRLTYKTPNQRNARVPPRCSFQRVLAYICFHVKFLTVTALPLCAINSAVAAGESQNYAGIWQFGHKEVFVSISETGETYQCRLVSDGTLFEARGSLVSPDRIAWQPATASTESGDPFALSMLGDNFTWGAEKLLRRDAPDELVLDGQFGASHIPKSRIPGPAAALAALLGKNPSGVRPHLSAAARIKVNKCERPGRVGSMPAYRDRFDSVSCSVADFE